jgi:hypothetical protein
MCSVLQSPIHSAPNSIAFAASLGVSAFVLICNLLYLSAQDINVPKSPDKSGSTVFNSPWNTSHVDQSKEIISHSLNTFPFITNDFSCSFTCTSEHPDTQHFHIHLATTAA